MDGGALGAKLAGAGGGGTIIALACDTKPVVEAMKQAGASRILYPKPRPGATVFPLENAADRERAERELVQRSEQADIA